MLKHGPPTKGDRPLFQANDFRTLQCATKTSIIEENYNDRKQETRSPQLWQNHAQNFDFD